MNILEDLKPRWDLSICGVDRRGERSGGDTAAAATVVSLRGEEVTRLQVLNFKMENTTLPTFDFFVCSDQFFQCKKKKAYHAQ